MTGGDSLFSDPEIGSIWQGCGMTCRVLAIVGEGSIYDVRVERLTGLRGLLNKPAASGLVAMRAFTEGRMKPFDPTADDPWTRAIVERYP